MEAIFAFLWDFSEGNFGPLFMLDLYFTYYIILKIVTLSLAALFSLCGSSLWYSQWSFLLEKFCICFFKELCATSPGATPMSVSNWGIPYAKECTVRLHTQVWQGLGASGVWETVLCPPRSWAQTSLTAASLGWDMDFVWFLHVEAVALWGFSFMQRSQLQPPSLLGPSADATLAQMQQDLFLYLTSVPLHLPSQGLCHIGLYTLSISHPSSFLCSWNSSLFLMNSAGHSKKLSPVKSFYMQHF